MQGSNCARRSGPSKLAPVRRCTAGSASRRAWRSSVICARAAPPGDREIVGDAADLAVQVRLSAQPDIVAIEPATRRLVGGLFDCVEFGSIDTAVTASPCSVWQVLGESVVESRFEALRGSALTRLIGRDEEIELLLRRWARAKAGEGQVVLVSGEPGLGKSRLIAALEERLLEEQYFRLRYFCSPYHQDSALYPFVDQLGRAAGFARDDVPAGRLEKLEILLEHAGMAEEDGTFLADLLALPAPERPRAAEHWSTAEEGADAGGAERAARGPGAPTAGGRGVRGRALGRCDVSRAARYHRRTRARFAGAADRDIPAGVSAALDRAAWGDDAGAQSAGPARPDRIDFAGCREGAAGQRAGPDRRPQRWRAAVCRGTDQECVGERTAASGGGSLLARRGAAAVRDPDEPVCVIAGAAGSAGSRCGWWRRPARRSDASFPTRCCARFRVLSEDRLRAALLRLVGSELVFQRGTPPDAVYSFKHALVQDVAYGSLLRGSRRRLHARIVEALEARFAGADGDTARVVRAALRRGWDGGEIHCRVGRGGAAVSGALGVGGGCGALSKGAGPVGVATGEPGRICDRSWNSAAHWVRCCGSSKDRRRRKRARPMPAHESCGSSWVLRWSSVRCPMGSRCITCIAANWIWRGGWARSCCG